MARPKTPSEIEREHRIAAYVSELRNNIDIAEAIFVHSMSQDIDKDPMEAAKKAFEAVRVFGRERNKYGMQFFKSRGVTSEEL